MIYQMRKLKPPPKVIPPKPPAYLFEPEEAAKPSNGLDFAEARVPVQKSASLYDGKHDKFAGDNLYRDIVNDPEINFEEDVRRQMELLEKDIKKMVGGASSSSSAIANEPNGDLGKRSRRAAAEYSVPIDDIHSDRNRNSYYDEAPIDRRQYQQELPESVDSVGYAKKLEPDKGPPHRVGGGLAHMYEEDSYRNLVNEKKANYARLLQEQVTNIQALPCLYVADKHRKIDILEFYSSDNAAIVVRYTRKTPIVWQRNSTEQTGIPIISQQNLLCLLGQAD